MSQPAEIPKFPKIPRPKDLKAQKLFPTKTGLDPRIKSGIVIGSVLGAICLTMVPLFVYPYFHKEEYSKINEKSLFLIQIYKIKL